MKKVLLMLALGLVSSNAQAFQWQIKAVESHYSECGGGRKALLVMDKGVNSQYNLAFVCLPDEQLAVIMKNMGAPQESYLAGKTFDEKLEMRSAASRELISNLKDYHAAAKAVAERIQQ